MDGRRTALVAGLFGLLVVSVVGTQAQPGSSQPVVVAATPAAQATTAPKPPEATITANLTGDAFSKNFNSSDHLLIRTEGDPPKEVGYLVDASGLREVTVQRADLETCKEIEVRSTGLGQDEWCLSLTGIDVG